MTTNGNEKVRGVAEHAANRADDLSVPNSEADSAHEYQSAPDPRARVFLAEADAPTDLALSWKRVIDKGLI